MPTLSASNTFHRHGTRHSTRPIAVFVALSLLIHGLLFLALVHEQRQDAPRAGTSRAPIAVRLLPAAPEPGAAPAPPAPPVASAAPQPRPTPKAARTARPRSTPKIARSAPAHPKIARREAPAPARPDVEKSAPQQEASRAAPPPMDMMSMLEAARARRRAAMDGEAAPGGAPAADNVALANINRDLQRYGGARGGTGNVYVRLTHTGVRTAQFQIRGFNPVSGDRWRQTIDVDAGPDGDVQQATVQKMIEWIRAHYSGDFNWESHRLDRVFTLSARPRDNAELQAFLMQEFFSG